MVSTDSEIQVPSKTSTSHVEESEKPSPLRLDPHGFPLRPQPSSSPSDPLNWPPLLKLWILFNVSNLAFLGPFTQAVINSAFAPLARSFDIAIPTASYVTNVAILGAGLTPLFLSPLANVYGRRPVFLAVTAVGVASHAASAVAKTWSGILVARFFVGVGTSAGMGVGAAVVADLYFLHERGRMMGVYTVFVTNGAHVAAMIGGPIAREIGVRACFWIPAIILGAQLVVMAVALPETLYRRRGDHVGIDKVDWWKNLTFRANTGGRGLKLWDFTHVFVMLRYPSVLFPTLYYSIHFGLGSVLFAVTGAAAFGGIYHFDTVGVGLAIGVSTFVGTLVGELLAGPVSDRLVYLYAKAHDGDQKAETRLFATIPGAILIPIGVVIEGVCFQFKTHWMGPIMGISIAAFGLQIVTTNIYAYITDCYKPQSAEISTLLNFGRQIFSFTLGFYMTPFAEETTYGIAWAVMAIIGAVLYAGIVALMFKGRQWREKLSEPSFDRDV
ncbi:major facilitator superfamily domain-containing protein [Elsinoe ampelina]|uniref:Major facilitator superfamily domain-containing protein n=1 Tax=Elsinoe ampelina TaxID=302913 RepID=A0A6A6G0H3_9PEZI|nr:major facilitator superfamily domain-containing protein [Elsinoe ampelina]